jgi:hypothetical protein
LERVEGDIDQGAILNWSSRSFGAVRSELRDLRKKPLVLRPGPGRVGPSYEEIKVEQRIVELNVRDEIMWRQRARVQWLAEGEKNTNFFIRKLTIGRKKLHCPFGER